MGQANIGLLVTVRDVLQMADVGRSQHQQGGNNLKEGEKVLLAKFLGVVSLSLRMAGNHFSMKGTRFLIQSGYELLN